MLASEARAAFEAFPSARLAELLRGGRAIVLAPHPDDESLGCGGLIAACCAASSDLVPDVVIVTDGAASHPGSREYPPARLRETRMNEARAAVASLGLPEGRLHFLGLPDAGAPWRDDLVATALASLAGLVGDDVSVILAPWGSDPHCDHEGTQQLARSLARETRLPLLNYPVWGWLLDDRVSVEESAVRGWRLDIAPYVGAKRRAVFAHNSQHGGLIDDAPDGFTLPDTLLSLLLRDYEIYFEPA